MGRYDTAQVCTRGHVISDTAGSRPELRQKFCHRCGATTIMQCPSCSTPIRGDYDVAGVVVLGSSYEPPAYCHECGAAYPWTEERLSAAADLIDLAELEAAETEALKADLVALTTDTPRTPLAATRMKRFFLRAGAEVGGGLKTILVEVATAAARKQMGL